MLQKSLVLLALTAKAVIVSIVAFAATSSDDADQNGVLCCGPPPERVDGGLTDRAKKTTESPSWQEVSADKLPQMLREFDVDFAIHRAPDDQGILFHQRRRLDDGELLLLISTCIEHPTSGRIESRLKGAEE